jgi:hypothetical protein
MASSWALVSTMLAFHEIGQPEPIVTRWKQVIVEQSLTNEPVADLQAALIVHKHPVAAEDLHRAAERQGSPPVQRRDGPAREAA